MKIRLKVSLSGADFSFSQGQEVEIDDDIAKQWIEADYAENLSPTPSKKAKAESEKESG